MDLKKYQNIEKSISQERLSVYCADGADTDTVLARYFYNIELCKSLYPLISIFEVTLRNSIDTSLCAFYGLTDWNNLISLQNTEQTMIAESLLKIKRNGKKYSHGRLIAELTLGFWTALMGRKYNTQKFQYAIVKNAFPNCPKTKRTTSQLQKDLSEIRFLRNRIAHHERILHWQDLKLKHDTILDFIGWMNPDLQKIAIDVDTFPDVYNAGLAPFLQKAENDWN